MGGRFRGIGSPSATMPNLRKPGEVTDCMATVGDGEPVRAFQQLAARSWRSVSERDIAFPSETVRNTWEAWHYGFTAGPAPCSRAGNAIAAAGGLAATGGGDGSLAGGGGLPAFVPARFRTPLLRSATRWNVSAA